MEPVAVHYPTMSKKYTGSLSPMKRKEGETFCVKIMNADVRYQRRISKQWLKPLRLSSRRT